MTQAQLNNAQAHLAQLIATAAGGPLPAPPALPVNATPQQYHNHQAHTNAYNTQQLNALTVQLQQAHAETAAATAAAQAATAAAQALAANPPPALNVANPPATPNLPRQPKVVMPDKWDGKDREKCEHFINDIDNIVSQRPLDYPTDESKIRLVVSLLTDHAKEWWIGNSHKYINLIPGIQQPTFHTFCQDLTTSLGISDHQEISEAAILRLEHRSGSPVSNFTQKYRHLLYRCSWRDSNEACISNYKQKLSPELTSLLVSCPPSAAQRANFDLFTQYVMELDNRMHAANTLNKNKKRKVFGSKEDGYETEHYRTAKKKSKDSGSKRYQLRHVKDDNDDKPSKSGLKGGSPTTKSGPITPDIRKYRKDNNLCMYCGSDQHLLAECDVKPKRQAPDPNSKRSQRKRDSKNASRR